MSLDKSINSGKEKRKPYYKSGKFDTSCRPHGGCPYCEGNRNYSENKRKDSANEQLESWEKGDIMHSDEIKLPIGTEFEIEEVKFKVVSSGNLNFPGYCLGCEFKDNVSYCGAFDCEGIFFEKVDK